MDSFEKFNQTELPTKKQFFSILNDQHITNEEYDHARKVWKTFNIKTMGEYHDLYLKNNMLLLADVFEKLQKDLLTVLQIGSMSLFHKPWSQLGRYVKNDQH